MILSIVLFLGLSSWGDDKPTKDQTPRFSSTDLQSTIRWVGSLQQREESARKKSIADKNGIELGKVQEAVRKEFQSIIKEQVKWQAKVIIVDTSYTKVEKYYTAGKISVEVVYSSASEAGRISNKGLEGVKPGEWIWVNGTINRVDFGDVCTIYVVVASAEKVIKKR